MTLVTLDEKFREDVADLLDLPELHASRERVHHFDLTEYDHLLGVARTAHQVSRFLRADARVSARAGLLHDLGAHWFNTVKPVALATRLALQSRLSPFKGLRAGPYVKSAILSLDGSGSN